MAIGLPQMIVDMTRSTEPQMKILEVVEKEDGKPTFEGAHELEGSPSPSLSPKDLCDHQNRILEYARTGRVVLGREFYDIMMKSMEDD